MTHQGPKRGSSDTAVRNLVPVNTTVVTFGKRTVQSALAVLGCGLAAAHLLAPARQCLLSRRARRFRRRRRKSVLRPDADRRLDPGLQVVLDVGVYVRAGNAGRVVDLHDR